MKKPIKNTASIAENSSKEPPKVEGPQDNGPATDEDRMAQQAQAAVSEADLPTLQGILNKIDPKRLEQADTFFPATELIQYLAVNEKKVDFLLENMPTQDRIKQAFSEAIQKNVPVMPQPLPGQGQQQGGAGWQQILGFLPQLMGSGGGDGYAELGKQMAEMALTNMQKNNSLVDAITNYVTTAMGAKIGKGIVDQTPI